MSRTKRGLSGLAATALSSATLMGLALTGGGVASATPAPPPPPAGVYNLTVTSSDANVMTDGLHDAYPGAVDQSAADWLFSLNNDFSAGEKIVLNVGSGYTANGTKPAVTDCVNASDYVAFAKTPSISVNNGTTDAGNGASMPLIHVSVTSQDSTGPCAGIKDQLTLTVMNPATGDLTGTNNWSVDVRNISYNLGSGTKADLGGNKVGIAGTDTPTGTGATAATLDTSGATNAKVEDVGVKANSPTVALTNSSSGPAQGAISNIIATEEYPGQLAHGTGTAGGKESVCLASGSWFTGPATITVSGSNALVSATGASGSFANPIQVSNNTNDNCYYFWLQEATGTTGSTITLSGLHAASDSENAVSVSLTDFTANQSATTTAFSVFDTNRISGYTADDTAIASFNDAFCTYGDCLTRRGPAQLAPVVMTSDGEPYDALAGNFLASSFNTGVLLTNPFSVPTNVLNELRLDGIGTVYLLGGTGAVSQAVQNQLSSTQAYREGGTSPVTTIDPVTHAVVPVNIQVIRIGGQTADDTANLIDQYFGFWDTNSLLATPGAYAVTNGNDGAYNNTTGNASTTAPAWWWDPSTVILASDSSYQDALAASPLSYWGTNGPLQVVLTPGNALSTAAAQVIGNLNPQQVIVVGGPGAISNAVVTAVQNMGPSVLRIAGQNYSDTSQQLARFTMSSQDQNGQANGLGYYNGGSSVVVGSARGDSFADALTSAADLGSASCNWWWWSCNNFFNPLLLTQSTNTVGSSIDSFLQAAGSPEGIGLDHALVDDITSYGGTSAQTPALVQQEVNDLASGQANA